MKLTRKSEYGLLMLLFLARQKEGDFISLTKIAKKEKIPIKYLEHLAPVDSVSKYFYRSTPIEKEKKVLSLLKEIRNFITKKLEEKKLNDLI